MKYRERIYQHPKLSSDLIHDQLKNHPLNNNDLGSITKNPNFNNEHAKHIIENRPNAIGAIANIRDSKSNKISDEIRNRARDIVH